MGALFSFCSVWPCIGKWQVRAYGEGETLLIYGYWNQEKYPGTEDIESQASESCSLCVQLSHPSMVGSVSEGTVPLQRKYGGGGRDELGVGGARRKPVSIRY